MYILLCCGFLHLLPSHLLLLIILIWFLNNWPLTLPLWIYRFNLLRKMTPSGTLNLKNNTYILYYNDLRNICVKVWFPLCTSSILLEGVLQETEDYLVVTKVLIRTSLLDLHNVILHVYRIWLSGCCGNGCLPAFITSTLQWLHTVSFCRFKCKQETNVHIMTGSSFCKGKPLHLLFDEIHTKTISLYSRVPDL